MCEINTPCGGVLYEDVEITKELQACGIYDKLIFKCFNAHHLIVTVINPNRPVERSIVKKIGAPRVPARMETMRCENCSREFSYKVKAGYERKFCSVRCSALFQGQRLLVERSLQAV